MIVSLVEDYPNYMIINLDKVSFIKMNFMHWYLYIFFSYVLESYPADILVFIWSFWQLRDVHSHVIMLYLILVF